MVSRTVTTYITVTTTLTLRLQNYNNYYQHNNHYHYHYHHHHYHHHHHHHHHHYIVTPLPLLLLSYYPTSWPILPLHNITDELAWLVIGIPLVNGFRPVCVCTRLIQVLALCRPPLNPGIKHTWMNTPIHNANTRRTVLYNNGDVFIVHIILCIMHVGIRNMYICIYILMSIYMKVW